VAVQYHPEFRSKPLAPHPLFQDFVRASLARQREARGTPARAEATVERA
jgi:CTP synthase